jgi:hypothetical protein
MTHDQIKQRLTDAGLAVKPLEFFGYNAFGAAGVYQIIQDNDGDFGFRVSSAPSTSYWSWPDRDGAIQGANGDNARRIYAALMEVEG